MIPYFMLFIAVLSLISTILYAWWKVGNDERKEKETKLKEVKEKINQEKDLIEIYNDMRRSDLVEISKINYEKLKEYYEFLKIKK